jgi:glycosyltransferase involved in cell wall biosynthesis
MRVALAHSHAETLGGGERAVLGLAEGLAARHAVRLLLGRYVPERTFPELAAYPRQRLGRLDWLWRRPSDDVIVANSFGANLLALRNGARVVYWIHSTRSLFLASDARAPGLRARRALDWLAVKRAARLVANSHYTARRVRALYGREPDATIYPGVDLQLFRPRAGPAQYAITVGRLAPEKALERLLDLWRELADVPLLVVGGGAPAYVHELRARAPSNVAFAGPKLPAELARLYAGAALAVFTPRAEEFGIAPLEAMAAGAPVVAWREGGLVESVVDGQTGYLVSDEAAFRQRVRLLFRNGGLRRELAQAARARAEAFSWERAVRLVEATCRRLAESASDPPVRARPA